MVKSTNELNNLVKTCEDRLKIFDKQLEVESSPEKIKKIKTKIVKTKRVLKKAQKDIDIIKEENNE